MRCVTYLACATLVARALVEDDDDSQFMRMLSANSSNTTSTSTTTTTTTTTTGAGNNGTSSSNNNTSTGSGSGSGSGGGGEGSSSSAATNEGSGSGSGGSGATNAPPVVTVPAAIQDEIAALPNGTNTTAKTEIEFETSYTAPNPYFCQVSGNENLASCTSSSASSSGSSSGNSTRRNLQSQADINRAANLFCAAFSFTGSLAMCQGMGETLVKSLYQSSDANTAMKNCASGIGLPYFVASKSDQCMQTAANANTAKGACFENVLAQQNRDGSGVMKAPETLACTVSTGTTADAQTFTTDTKIAIPTWKVESDTAVTVNAADVVAAANTAAAATTNQDVLMAALVVAVVETSRDTSLTAVVAAANVTAAIGLSQAALDTLVAKADTAGTSLFETITLDEIQDAAAGTGSLASAVTEVKASDFATNLESGNTVTVTSSGATTIMAASSVVVGLLSLVF